MRPKIIDIPLGLTINDLCLVCSYSGCKVESVYLGVDSVNTHRDRPEVGIPGSTQKCLSADDVANLNPLRG